LAPIFIVISCVCTLAIIAYQSLKDDKELADEIKGKEDELEKNPERSKTAWDLATIKLESYLNRNLSQVRWIFFWSVLIMMIGFGIIGYGIFKVYENPDSSQPSILVTLAGVITQVIGATLLLIYKSTMAQAKDYVNVLERINAVGMSIQVIESLSKESGVLRDNAKAELAKELLKLYGNNPRQN
jgi:nitrate reductase gamma subunit